MIIQYNNYFISTGKNNKLYTLRQYVTKKVGEYLNDTNIHVKTLCADKKKAIVKAQEYINGTGKKLILTDIEVDDRASSTNIDWTVFQEGKYKGESYISVCNTDLKYVIFLIENYRTSDRYSKTLELCASIPAVKDELERISAKKREIERLVAEEKEKEAKEKKEVIANNGHFYNNGDQIELELTVVNVYSFQSKYGISCVMNLKDSTGKRFVYIGNGSILNFNENSGSFKVLATINHSFFRGIKQTHLKYPKIQK